MMVNEEKVRWVADKLRGNLHETFVKDVLRVADEWEERERGLEGEAKALRAAWFAAYGVEVTEAAWLGAPDVRKAWLAVARKARELHGKGVK